MRYSICFATAFCAIYDGLKVPLPFIKGTNSSGSPPESVLILGGSSSVGAAAIQLLRIAYPELPIFATSSLKYHAHLLSLGANKLFDYKSPSLTGEVKSASPGGNGVDAIIDCVGSARQQTNIYGAFSPAGSKVLSSVLTGPLFAVPEGVLKRDVDAANLPKLEGGDMVIRSISELVESGVYKVPLPVKIVGKGLKEVPEAMDLVKTVSGAKLIVTL